MGYQVVDEHNFESGFASKGFSMTPEPTVLFVDDEAGLRATMADLLSREGFRIQTAATVAEALARITAEKYDILIADLNIGEPGDGFTVVSAMRRVQPESATMILTGYPAFQAALRAIHEQVDDFLTKPAEPSHLLKSVRENLARRKTRRPVQTERLARIIEKHREEIIEAWYEAVENNAEMAAVKLSRKDRIDHLPELIDELVREQDAAREKAAHADAAAKHGKTRREQEYTVPMLLEEARILHQTVAKCAQDHLLTVDISNLIGDLVEVHDRLHGMLRESVEEFLRQDRGIQRHE